MARKTHKRNKTEQLYFIAIVIDESPGDEIYGFKQHIAKHYASRAALRSPPHITLHMPFAKPEKSEEMMKEKLTWFCRGLKNFEVEMKNFGCFDPRVIFVNVSPNEMLQMAQSSLINLARTELGIFNANFKDRPFYPHVTIGFRDLSRLNFSKAWDEFQNKTFHSIFQCKRIALLKHNGKTWDVNTTFPFG